MGCDRTRYVVLEEVEMTEFHLVGWLDDNLCITRLSIYDCPPWHLTRRFSVAPPVSLLVTSADSFEEAEAFFEKYSQSLLGPKLSVLLQKRSR
jgi:hypothetical protein